MLDNHSLGSWEGVRGRERANGPNREYSTSTLSQEG